MMCSHSCFDLSPSMSAFYKMRPELTDVCELYLCIWGPLSHFIKQMRFECSIKIKRKTWKLITLFLQSDFSFSCSSRAGSVAQVTASWKVVFSRVGHQGNTRLDKELVHHLLEKRDERQRSILEIWRHKKKKKKGTVFIWCCPNITTDRHTGSELIYFSR